MDADTSIGVANTVTGLLCIVLGAGRGLVSLSINLGGTIRVSWTRIRVAGSRTLEQGYCVWYLAQGEVDADTVTG